MSGKGKGIIQHGFPPNIGEIKRYIPDVMTTPGVVITYFPHVYIPGGQPLPFDLQVHEGVHLKQQERNPKLWWTRYLTEEKFRFEQEVEAYGMQAALFLGTGNKFDKVLQRLAFDLSGPAYGNIVPFGVALSAIRNYAKSVDPIIARDFIQGVGLAWRTEPGTVDNSPQQGVPESGDSAVPGGAGGPSDPVGDGEVDKG